MIAKSAPNPDMIDPSDQDIHRRGKRKANPTDDLADPAETDPGAPHDRGAVRDQELQGAREDMVEQVGKDKEAWRKGRTQNS